MGKKRNKRGTRGARKRRNAKKQPSLADMVATDLAAAGKRIEEADKRDRDAAGGVTRTDISDNYPEGFAESSTRIDFGPSTNVNEEVDAAPTIQANEEVTDLILGDGSNKAKPTKSWKEHSKTMLSLGDAANRYLETPERKSLKGNEPYMSDPVLMRRYLAMTQNYRDITESYLMHFRPDPRNTGVRANFMVWPGEENDIEETFGPECAPVWKRSLNNSQPFAFPQWWVQSRILDRRVEGLVEISKLTDHPMPEYVDDNGKGFRRATPTDIFAHLNEHPISQDLVNQTGLKRWEKNAKELIFPKDMPFRNMCVMLEWDDEQLKTHGKSNPGIRLYNRYHNDQDGVGELGCPTSAYVKGKEDPVPLDFIYMDGFLWDGSRTEWEFEGKPYDMIWALCSGYIISHEHCPRNRSFVRVPLSVLLYCGDENGKPMFVRKEEEDGRPQTPWIVGDNHHAGLLDEIIRAIDNHRVTSVGLTRKQQRKRKAAANGVEENSGNESNNVIQLVQLNFQRVNMRQEVQQQTGHSKPTSVGGIGGHSWTLTTRVKVRGHERVKIRRGLKPMREDDRLWLAKQGYRVYHNAADVPAEDALRFSSRGKDGPDTGAWAAIKHKRVQEYEKGPEDGKLVKVIRVPNIDVANQVISD